MKHAVAVKSFIVDENNNLLLIKRKNDNPHDAGAWEIPGGRLDPGENPFDGLKRETQEETGLSISINYPLHVRHFTRHDGQGITMIVFTCSPDHKEVQLSQEHEDHCWISIDKAKDKINPYFRQLIDDYNNRR